ncbi:E3 ubiquitin-protein ligase TTC3 isoform X5 [Prinia subflava]|uniref:E3 ubiquitin-protein ligase TTC3 isoform X5 n=1 Tax=Prinia subflava TaxID=208062 RepID=UPI002FE08905
MDAGMDAGRDTGKEGGSGGSAAFPRASPRPGPPLAARFVSGSVRRAPGPPEAERGALRLSGLVEHRHGQGCAGGIRHGSAGTGGFRDRMAPRGEPGSCWDGPGCSASREAAGIPGYSGDPGVQWGSRRCSGDPGRRRGSRGSSGDPGGPAGIPEVQRGSRRYSGDPGVQRRSRGPAGILEVQRGSRRCGEDPGGPAGIPGVQWGSRGTAEIPWSSGDPGGAAGIPEVRRGSRGSSGDPGGPAGIPGVQRGSRRCGGDPGGPAGIPGVQWGSRGTAGIAGYSGDPGGAAGIPGCGGDPGGAVGIPGYSGDPGVQRGSRGPAGIPEVRRGSRGPAGIPEVRRGSRRCSGDPGGPAGMLEVQRGSRGTAGIPEVQRGSRGTAGIPEVQRGSRRCSGDPGGGCARADSLSGSDLAAMSLFGGDPSRVKLGLGTFGQQVLPNRKRGVDPCEVWCSQPVEKLKEYCNVMKIRMFWSLLFTKESTSFVGEYGWRLLGFTMSAIHEFNILEDFADLIKKVVNVPYFISGILRIGSDIENDIFDFEEAVDWVKCVGDARVLQIMEQFDCGRGKLPLLFADWKRFITKVALENCDLVAELNGVICESSRKKSEAMKQKGNAEFSQGALACAILSYTKAIELCPINHLLYGNRALCFIHTGQYEKAVMDGKRAIILRPDWPKGHYHYCRALALLGRADLALEANERAQQLCQDGPEGLRELVQQRDKLRKSLQEETPDAKHKQKGEKPPLEKKGYPAPRAPLRPPQEPKAAERERRRGQAQPGAGPGPAAPPAKQVTQPQRAEGKVSTPEQPPNQSQQNKRKPKTKSCDCEKMRDNVDLKKDSKATEDESFCAVPQVDHVDFIPNVEALGQVIKEAMLDKDKPIILPLMRALNNPKCPVDFNSLSDDVKGLARDGCRALLEQQCHGAERAFSQLLSILYSPGFSYVNLLNINYVIFLYGHATALLGMGNPEALAKAELQFKKIMEEYPEESCFCLAHYGIGRVYLRQNRFVHALDQFLRSKLMIDFKIVPGVLMWPGTTQVIEETRTEHLQMALRNYIEECIFPPEPDAVCRYHLCHGYSKIQIYFTDPDFKGFIRVICCQQCRVEFHISCWKKLKTASYSDKNDKDFLKEMCFTPDCKGLISKIVIFSSSGLVKCEFEQKIPKPKEPPRPCIKQKSSSLRKIKMKQEKKLRRKRAREEARNSARKKAEENQEGNEQSQYSQHRGCGQDLCAGDQVLQHLRRNSERIKGAVPDPAVFLRELLAWGVITEQEFTSYSQISSSQEVLEQLLSSLIQAKSRVRTRGFLHVLSQLGQVEPKVHKWLQRLDNLGLTATKNFLLQYGKVLQELDLSILTPVWNQKYGSKFDCVAADGEKQEICDYFLTPPLEKSRCFIWLLEENREHFPGLHQALDEFFDKMGDPTIILKKQGNENLSNNEIKVKNKNRKKNWKDSKSILVLSSGVSTAPREEEKIFIEENNLYRDFPNEPFAIPEYLQDQLEEFEALYNVSNSNNYQMNNNNNTPDPICENLYEYFSQILEEHGPLEINNKLLVGEYENFPEETRKVVEDEGGLEPFLLKSPRFILVDNLIGLKKHSVLFEGNSGTNERNKEENDEARQFQGNSSHTKVPLNPYAQEFRPLSYPVEGPGADLTDYEAPEYLPCSFPAPCTPGNVLEGDAGDAMADQAPFSGVLLAGFEPALFLPQSSWGYQYGILPLAQPILAQPGLAQPALAQPGLAQPGLAQPALPCAAPAAPQHPWESAPPHGKCSPEGFVPGEPQESQSLRGLEKEDPAGPNGSDEAEGGKWAEKEKGRRNEAGMKSNPHSRMVAVQVNQEVAHRETNTLPFQPFENQQGDILRMEKEHQVLKEQLREAEEKYEQLQSRSSEEICALEGLLKKRIEETEVSQNELDWFHQDSEAQMKKWQQEKKENRENLKALKGTAKKHSDTNERYLKTIEEKEKQYNACLNTFLETSNKFAHEKGKLEDLIKKSQGDSQECEKRAVKAEVSVLQTWKETEIWKLKGTIAKAEGNLRVLKALSSSSAPAAPVLKSQIDSWEIFISNVKKQLEKVEAEYEEKIEQVTKGARNCLSKVEIVDFACPQGFAAIPGRVPSCDPAIVTRALPAFSEGKAPAQPVPAQSGAQAAPAPSEAAPAAGKAPAKAPEGSQSRQPSPSCPAGIPASDSQPVQSHQDPSALQPRPPGIPNNTKLQNTIGNILAQLQNIFPSHSSSELLAFIKEVQRRNGNTVAGLSPDEILNRATELILDRQLKAAAGRAGLPPRSRDPPAAGTAPGSPRAAPKIPGSKNPSQPNLQPWGNAGAVPKAKWKKQDSVSSEDPCSICHDELSRDSCELECGHHFHRECIRLWLKQHSSTCPMCRGHALLPEDFPELPAWNKNG